MSSACASGPREASQSGRARDDRVARNFVERGRSRLAHDGAQFASIDFQDCFNTGLAKCPESPGVRPSEADCRRAECQRFKNIRATAHTAVDNHRRFARNGFDDLRKALNGRAQRIFRASAVIGNDQTIHAVLDRQLSVFARDDAFDQEFNGYGIAQPLHKLPVRGPGKHLRHLRNVQPVEHRFSRYVTGEASFQGAGPRLALREGRVATAMACRALALVYARSEEHTSELQSPVHLVCRLLLEKKKQQEKNNLSAQTLLLFQTRYACPLLIPEIT